VKPALNRAGLLFSMETAKYGDYAEVQIQGILKSGHGTSNRSSISRLQKERNGMEPRNRNKSILPRALVQSEMKTHTRRLLEGLSCGLPHHDPSNRRKNAPRQDSPINTELAGSG
jgi:hypothetical protein